MSRLDRLNADLERGYSALDDGRLDDAATCLERCRRIDREHPDVLALDAAIADARGDVDGALAKYEQLVDLVPADPIPRICIARLQLVEHGDAAAALATIDAALPLIEDDADFIDTIMLRVEALLARGALKDARSTLGELDSSPIDDVAILLDLAELAVEAEDAAAARRWAERARKADPSVAADALHLIGRAHEVAGDRAAMIATWQQVRALDANAPPAEVSISEDELERVAVAALGELPADVRARLEHVPILIADRPSAEQIDAGTDPRLLGLFDGTPMSDALAPTVTTIHLFRANLERGALDLDHLAEEVRITVLHETGHYFGMDEEDLERVGLD
jgi:predicted Zn-dependent protease with MMP-like domain/Flp pilus assembly protein TadD